MLIFILPTFNEVLYLINYLNYWSHTPRKLNINFQKIIPIFKINHSCLKRPLSKIPFNTIFWHRIIINVKLSCNLIHLRTSRDTMAKIFWNNPWFHGRKWNNCFWYNANRIKYFLIILLELKNKSIRELS